jgi:hypothetical protein
MPFLNEKENAAWLKAKRQYWIDSRGKDLSYENYAQGKSNYFDNSESSYSPATDPVYQQHKFNAAQAEQAKLDVQAKRDAYYEQERRLREKQFDYDAIGETITKEGITTTNANKYIEIGIKYGDKNLLSMVKDVMQTKVFVSPGAYYASLMQKEAQGQLEPLEATQLENYYRSKLVPNDLQSQLTQESAKARVNLESRLELKRYLMSLRYPETDAEEMAGLNIPERKKEREQIIGELEGRTEMYKRFKSMGWSDQDALQMSGLRKSMNFFGFDMPSTIGVEATMPQQMRTPGFTPSAQTPVVQKPATGATDLNSRLRDKLGIE